MAKNLIILPCCSRKNHGGNALNARITFFENENTCTQLINKRNIRMIQSPPLNPNNFMRAWDRYDGVIYRRIKHQQNLIDELIKEKCLDIIIMSAMYGIINYDTYINNYDLEIRANGGISFWGQDNVISSSINSYCMHTGVEQIYSFLNPNTYYRGLAANALVIEHFQSWPIGLRGPTNVLNHVSDQIVERLNNISSSCSSSVSKNRN